SRRESAKPRQGSKAAVSQKAWPATPILSSVSSMATGIRRPTRHGRQRGGAALREGPLQLPPFPSLSGLFRTARSGQGRAGFARRSEPLTARTVLEDGDDGKGGGGAGVSPAGFGAAPQFYVRGRTRSTTKKPELPANWPLLRIL